MSFIGSCNRVSGDTLLQVPTHEYNTFSNVNTIFESGNGVDFSDTARAGATTQVFDDYAEGTWTVTAANLTEVGGAATLTGRYTKIGNQVFFKIRIEPVTNTSATAGTTYFGPPFVALETSVCKAVGVAATTSLGTGLISTTAGRIYPPSWTTETGDVIITGDFILD